MDAAGAAERAARAVATSLGLPAGDARVLSAGSNVLVDLAPSPVVARVFTGTAALHDGDPDWPAREVAVGAFLAARGLAVAPTALADPGPHAADGLRMTLWERVDPGAGTPPDPAAVGRLLREAHGALADYAGALPPLADVGRWLAALADGLPAPERTVLRRELDVAGPATLASGGSVQALHGDASVSNLLATAAGPRWSDLEDVCVGPVSWDVAGLVVDLRRRGAGEDAVEAFLAAYGWHAPGALAPALRAHAAYDAVWAAHVRRPGPTPPVRPAPTAPPA